jgi:hypothetical protein
MQCDNGTLVCRCGRYTQQEDNIVRKVSTFSQRRGQKNDNRCGSLFVSGIK